jgi:hypothetical protein
MFFAVTVIFGLIGLLASLVGLLEFARVSRGDNLYLPATSGSARRARRLTGMYARGGQSLNRGDLRDETFGGEVFAPGGEIALAARPHHDQLAAH